MGRLAILAGQGALPFLLADAHRDALVVHFEGVEIDTLGREAMLASYERFGELFDGLHAAGISDVVLAGSIGRPTLNPANFDAKMMELAPSFLAALQVGDDEILRAVICAFESHGFKVRGAHELVDTLTCDEVILTSTAPNAQDVQDVAKAQVILDTLSPLDIGQGCVVARGLCLGIETVQGTDAMLRFVAETRGPKTGGVLVKRPKLGQDLRVDMPAIGPETVDLANAAGLRGIAIAVGSVMVLERDEVLDRANQYGLAIWATV